MTDEIMAIGEWKNNAELIADCFTLGYIDDDNSVLDCTYGLGRFWNVRTPKLFVACDANPEKSPFGESVDYRSMPFDTGEFGSVVFDPPYRLAGKTQGGGPVTSDESYGIVDDSVPWQERHADIKAGITECVRVLEVKGFLLVKCQDQVNSGKVRWQTREFADHAESLGCRLVDQLMLTGYRKQPAGRSQKHARRNYSTLLVLRLEKRRVATLLDELILNQPGTPLDDAEDDLITERCETCGY